MNGTGRLTPEDVEIHPVASDIIPPCTMITMMMGVYLVMHPQPGTQELKDIAHELGDIPDCEKCHLAGLQLKSQVEP